MSRASPAVLLVVALSLPVLAQPAPAPVDAPRLPNTWVNRASFFFGARGGIAIPPEAEELAPNASLEFGVAVPTGFGLGLRFLWMNSPPSVPLFGLPAAKYGFGAMADFRYYFETIDPLIIYPTLAVGFLAGQGATSTRNVVLPLLNPGLGAKLRLGNFYVTFEFGAAGFTIPYLALALGYEADSKAQKEAQRRNVTVEEVLAPPSPTTSTGTGSPLAPRWTAPPVAPQPAPAPPRAPASPADPTNP